MNPAFTSVIGTIKFAASDGLSPYAAMVAIARRGLEFGERLRRYGLQSFEG